MPIFQRSGAWLADTFRALRHRNYLLYFVGQFVSITGSWLQTTALMWLAYEKTGHSSWPAAITAAQVLPTFVLGVWGGSLADRWPKRTLIFVTQAVQLVLAVLLAGLVFLDLDSVEVLFAVALASGVVNGIDLPARMAFVVEMVGKEDLLNAVALNSLLFNAARVIGPAVGASLLHVVGAGTCFLANGVSFIAVLAALAAMDSARFTSTPVRHRDPQFLRGGLSYLAARPWLLGLVLLSGVLSFFGWPVLALLPALADRNLKAGSGLYGAMVSAVGVGAMIAALLMASCGSMRRRRLFLVGGVALLAAALALLSLVETKTSALVCCAVAGCGLILYFATAQAVTQLSSGDHNRGLIMGVWSMVLCGAQPLGCLLSGWAADAWGVPAVLVIQAVGIAAAGVGVLMVLPRGESDPAAPRPDVPDAGERFTVRTPMPATTTEMVRPPAEEVQS
jgi:MFS family permease